MKNGYVTVCLLLIFSCKTGGLQNTKTSVAAIKTQINTNIDTWHQAASDANFNAYFNLMTKDGVFIGTDATENWQNEEFRTFSKPYFDNGEAWSFTAIDRNIYISEDKSYAWFDELLNTQMKICRGSGIMRKENNQWKIAHYVLSIAIPNENVDDVIKLKENFDDAFIQKSLEK